MKLVTSDAHAGFVAAIGAIATWCVVATLPNALRGELDVDHSENAMAWGCPPGWSPWGRVKTMLHSIYDQQDSKGVAEQ